MLPTMRHRMVMAVAIFVGAAVWLFTFGFLEAADGASGLSLMSAPVGGGSATVIVAVAGLFALGMGLIASVMGNPLSGVFAVSAGLCVLAWKGGDIDGWMLRAQMPGDYGQLMIEMVIWQVGVVWMLLAIQWLRSPMRAKWPALAYQDHLGVDVHLIHPHLQAWAAGLVCALCGGGLGYFLIRTSDVGQVIGSLFFAFAVGGLVVGLFFPSINPVGVLFSPALVALAVYVYMMTGFESDRSVLEAWYSQRLPGLVLALPIHYVSAGVAGCVAGVGLAQGIDAAKVRAIGA